MKGDKHALPLGGGGGMVHCVVVQWHDRQRVDDPVLVCMHECTWQVSLCVNDEEMLVLDVGTCTCDVVVRV